MNAAEHPPTLPRGPIRARLPRILELALLIVMALAAGVDLLSQAPAAPLAIAVLVLLAAGTAIGHRRPLLGLPLVAAAPLVAVAVELDPLPYWSMTCFAAMLLTLRGAPGLPVALVIGVANLGASGLASGTLDLRVDATPSVAAFAGVAGAVIGAAVLSQQRYRAQLEERARDAVSTRERAIELGVAEERLRIARDLHDAVGHRMAVVSMHLGGAEVHLDRDRDAARASLLAARSAVQAVLEETQRILRVLRVGDEPEALAPLPGAAAIPELVAQSRAAGLTIEARLEGLDDVLESQAGTAAFRIVQESLTNARRHGTGAVELDVVVTGATLRIEVANDRADAASALGSGYGLIGMRERAESAGGRLEVRPGARRFRVVATLPIPTAADDRSAS